MVREVKAAFLGIGRDTRVERTFDYTHSLFSILLQMGCAISQEETFSLADLGLEIEDAGKSVKKIQSTGHSKEVVTFNLRFTHYCILNWIANMRHKNVT